MRTARCPHCGLAEAPVEGGLISRHRRADWSPTGTGKLNGIEVCAGGGLWLRVGERCRHLSPDPNCLDAEPVTDPGSGRDGPDGSSGGGSS